jgi:hypothetical protein
VLTTWKVYCPYFTTPRALKVVSLVGRTAPLGWRSSIKRRPVRTYALLARPTKKQKDLFENT